MLLFFPLLVYAQPDLKALDKYIEQARQAWQVPGMSVAVVKDGEIVWAKGYGTLQAKVRDYLPDFALYDDYASNQATIRDLLCHRLGLGTFSGDVIWYKSNYKNWDNMGAAGGIISNAEDMARWMLLQLQHGIYNGDTLFSPALPTTTSGWVSGHVPICRSATTAATDWVGASRTTAAIR